MGLGLFLGIVGFAILALIHGGQVNMANAYKHVAIPVAILSGTMALIGATLLEVRAHRTSR
jgi:nitrate reductase gamma subunit